MKAFDRARMNQQGGRPIHPTGSDGWDTGQVPLDLLSMKPAGPGPRIFALGLDLGKQRDYSALTVIERTGQRPYELYQIRHLQRWPLGTAYPDVIAGLRDPIEKIHSLGCESVPVAFDVTGVGLGVWDFAKRDPFLRHSGMARLIPMLITTGMTITKTPEGHWHVPKKELISVVAATLGTRQLRVAPTLPAAAALWKELENFSVKVTASGNEVMESWRESDHDDLVLSASIALFHLVRQRTLSVY
jgi:hypothetical protein